MGFFGRMQGNWMGGGFGNPGADGGGHSLRADFFDRAQHGRRAFSLLAVRRHPARARHCSDFTPPHY